jgi:hypothetical protein
VVEAQESTGKDGYRVLAVRDAGERLDVGIDVICEVLITNARRAVYESLELGAGREVKR